MTKKKYSFKHYRRLPHKGHMKNKRSFYQEFEKAFTWLQFDDSKQTTFAVFMVNFLPLRNVIERKM